MVLPSFTSRFPDLLAPALASRDRRLLDLVTRAISPPGHGYYTFEPRDDNPAEFDEQTAFVNDTTSKLSIALGGTGSGKTLSAAYKTAKYVLETPPPVNMCPFWIMGEKFDQICQVAWLEKLSKLIPETEILDIQWYLAKRRWPRAVMLRHPVDRAKCGWILEFRSYEQGIGAIKAVSIGGYWLNEEVPYSQIAEVQGRCRDYDSPGWADFTPVECKSQEWPDAYENPPEGWRFYHLNTEKNSAVSQDWIKRYLASIPEDMRETRRIGAFSVLRGAVYKEFRKSIHVIDWDKFKSMTGYSSIPRDWRKIRGMDFGHNNPTCCLWIARDHDDHWFVYDEHYANQQLISHHAEKINERGEWPNDPWHGPTYSDHDATWRAELIQYGIKCSLARKIDGNAGIMMLRSMMMPSESDGRPKIYILNNCENLIREIPGYRWMEGTAGKSPKDMPVDKDNHCLIAGTMVETKRGEVPIEQVTENDFVFTRNGLKRVLWSGATLYDSTLCVMLSNGETIEGTANHPVWVNDRGWVRLENLAIGDELLSLSEVAQSWENKSLQNRELKLLNSKERSTDVILTQNVLNCESIISIGEAGGYIKRYGKAITEKYQLATTSTIKMRTRSIMQSRILKRNWGTIIYQNIRRHTGRQRLAPLCLASQQNAIYQEKCTSGGKRNRARKLSRELESKVGLIDNQANILANNAGKNLTLFSSKSEYNFVPISVEPQHDEKEGMTTFTDYAHIVESCSRLTDTSKIHVAPVRVVAVGHGVEKKQTYDLTVEDCPEFFANGVLVHNSLDAMRYAIYSDRVKFVKDEGISQARVQVDPKKHGVQFARKGG